MASLRVFQMQRFSTLCALTILLTVNAAAQSSSSSSSSPAPAQASSSVQPRAGQPEAGGAAITLETSEPLFDLATGLNACGYDADLANSNPVRAEIRAEVAAVISQSAEAKASRDALCSYMQDHELSDKGRELAQYVSLALYVSPAPKLAPTVDETEMPPDALAVVNVLPLIRTFAEKVSLHAIWLKHRAEYEAITDKVHDPITQAILGTNVYLKVPVSSYDGRRLLILVEPMLAPNSPNARIYSSNYIVVTSPTAAGAIRMDQIRHLYLHYTIEPLVYARAASMQRLTPLLKPVQDAPLDYVYKTDIVALLTECLIKAIEARTMDVGLTVPIKPTGTRARTDLARYDEELASYERQAEVFRRKQVDLDMRQGWVMVEYFYNQLLTDERNPDGLSERMGQMVYGMDVGRERHRAEQIQFLPQGSGEFVRRAPRQPTGMMLAEKKMLEGDLDGAMAIAEKGLADPKQDHAEAMYVKAQVELMEGDPKDSQDGFEDVLRSSKNPRTTAWAHIYLGRLYDIKQPTERNHAVEQYKAALAVTGVAPDARAAADKGLKAPFVVPKIVHEEEEPLDPSGKAEKQAYKPDPN
jgi:tetratricopeptide (TPR) repeat protein